MSVSVAPLFDESGELAQVVHVARDITERKRAEERLRRSEAYLAEAQRLTHTGSWVRNKTGEILYLSEELYRIFGLDPQAGVPSRETLRALVHPDDVGRAVASIEEAVRDKSDTFVEYRIVLADGTVKHIQVIQHPVLNDAGDVVELLGTAIDITERKRDEEALRQSEAYLAEAQRLTHSGSWALDVANRTYTYVSEEIYRIFGFDRQQGLPSRETYLRTILPEDRDRVQESFQQSLGQRVDSFVEYRIALPDGTVKHIHTIRHPVLDDAGNVVQMLGTSIDITERKRAEERLRRSEAYLAEAQRLTHTGSWVRDKTGEILYLSEELYRIFGLDPQAGIPSRETLRRLVHPDDVGRAVASIEEAVREKSDTFVEYRIVLPDGTVKHIHTIRRPVLNEAGDVMELVGTSVDITERKQAEEALRESETRFRTFVDHAADAFFMLDCERGTIIDVNRPACESLGYTREELLGMDPMLFHLESDRAQMESVAARAAAGETAIDTHWHRRKDGVRFPVEVHTSAFQYRGRRFLLKVARDITERLKADEQRDRVRQLEADLAHINRVSVMGELSASIAHELGQPLAGVVSNGGACLRWLARDAPNLEEAQEAARRIVRDGKRAGDIIARIRALTKKTAAPKAKLVLNDTIQEVLTLVGDEAKRRSVLLRRQFAGDLSPVAGDRVQVQQVVLNLVMNAIEAMSGVSDRARELVITTRGVEPNEVQVTVEDSGPGLDPQAMDKIFDSFYSTKPTGMGMGLSICRSIVQAHGGRLWAEAKDGPGTMFHFTLPNYCAEDPQA